MKIAKMLIFPYENKFIKGRIYCKQKVIEYKMQ